MSNGIVSSAPDVAVAAACWFLVSHAIETMPLLILFLVPMISPRRIHSPIHRLHNGGAYTMVFDTWKTVNRI